jgi:hypothetical protein
VSSREPPGGNREQRDALTDARLLADAAEGRIGLSLSQAAIEERDKTERVPMGRDEH